MFIGNNMSVTMFCHRFSQPRGGLIKLAEFKKVEYSDNETLFDQENVHPSIMGIVIDYLTRFMFNNDAKKTFSLSLRAANIIRQGNIAERLISEVSGLDDKSIEAACKLSGYDVVVRAGAKYYNKTNVSSPNWETLQNIRTMVNRSIEFLKKRNVIDSGIYFFGGYTDIVSKGDADFLTEKSIVDLKVSRKVPAKTDILQVIVYQMLLSRSDLYQHLDINEIEIFNPRLNISYTLDIRNIKEDYYSCIYNSIYS